MSSLTEDSGQRSVSGTAETGPQSADREPLPTIRSALPGLACIPIDRGPSFFSLMTLALVAVCSALTGAVLLVAHYAPRSNAEQALVEWDEACLQGRESAVDFRDWLTGTPAYLGSPPGPGQYLAVSELKTYGELTLADAITALGEPDAACLDYGLLPGRKAVIWLRASLADGQVEAYAVLSPGAEHLTLDTPLHTLRCYTPGEIVHLRGTGVWRGFSPITAYRDCRYTSGTLTAP
jgi:hypothetical protein